MFKFGKNWKRFLAVLDDDRLTQADRSLKEMLGKERLEGLSFLDVGCGSGLFSLSAARLGARRILSFDYDSDSVDCATQLKARYFPSSGSWEIRRGSILDRALIDSLGTWDVVYAWGVLHHTGDLATALENIAEMVSAGGHIFLSIYNDQGRASRFWYHLKRAYNASFVFRLSILCFFIPFYFIKVHIGAFLRSGNPFTAFREYKKNRGMSLFHDWIDWLGGYPFEVAKPEEIFELFKNRGYFLVRLKTCAGNHGCNEFVFQRGIPARVTIS